MSRTDSPPHRPAAAASATAGRMTPQEIEAIISAHPDVLQCVVVTCGGGSREPILVAHYVLRPAAPLSTGEPHGRLVRLPRLDMANLVLCRHMMFPPSRNGTVDLGFSRPTQS